MTTCMKTIEIYGASDDLIEVEASIERNRRGT
jgi:hypothetical protein